MIDLCSEHDFTHITKVINNAAQAYKNSIPDDCWHEPYMTEDNLHSEINKGVRFYGYYQDNQLIGVIGLQNVEDVALVRHAYVDSLYQNKGIGKQLLHRIMTDTKKTLLVGAWADAEWAVKFYQRNGFQLVNNAEKDRLLQKYWSVPKRQRDTSVVLRMDANSYK